jgi:hypothetical protein
VVVPSGRCYATSRPVLGRRWSVAHVGTRGTLLTRLAPWAHEKGVVSVRIVQRLSRGPETYVRPRTPRDRSAAKNSKFL